MRQEFLDCQIFIGVNKLGTLKEFNTMEIIIALIVAGVAAYFIFRPKKTEEVVAPAPYKVEAPKVEEAPAPVVVETVVEAKPAKAKKAPAKKTTAAKKTTSKATATKKPRAKKTTKST